MSVPVFVLELLELCIELGLFIMELLLKLGTCGGRTALFSMVIFSLLSESVPSSTEFIIETTTTVNMYYSVDELQKCFCLCEYLLFLSL